MVFYCSLLSNESETIKFMISQNQNNADERAGALSISTNEFMAPMEALNPKDDSYIGFIRKGAQGVENLFSVTPRELREMLPELSQWLLEDAYFTVNGYYKPARWKNRQTGLPCVMRREDNLRYLNACYADLDIGRAGGRGAKGQSANEAAQTLFDLMFGGTLPQCSMTARSGRGMYVFWILRDEDDPTSAPRGDKRFYRERLELYKQVNRAICKRLESLAADDKAIDGARVLRTPDTAHGMTGARCVYSINHDETGALFTYTLSELASLFGVREMAVSLPESARGFAEIDEAFREFGAAKGEETERPKTPKRANGPKVLARDRAQDLTVLEQSRQGWKKGNRRFCLRLYAHFLRAAGCGRADALRAVETMARNCTPVYPSDASDLTGAKIVAEVWRDEAQRYTTRNLVKWLQITDEEARDLNLKRLIPQTLKDERASAKGKSPRETATEARRKLIYDWIIASGMKSTRDFVALLDMQGVKAGAQTVSRDLDALGFAEHSSRKKAGRKSSSEQLDFSELMATATATGTPNIAALDKTRDGQN